MPVVLWASGEPWRVQKKNIFNNFEARYRATRDKALLDQLWTRLRAVQLVCPADVTEAARHLAGGGT
jgi:hypothetical protein